MFLEILQNSQESTCARVSFFNKVEGLRPATLLKKRLWHSCFLVYSVQPSFKTTSLVNSKRKVHLHPSKVTLQISVKKLVKNYMP